LSLEIFDGAAVAVDNKQGLAFSVDLAVHFEAADIVVFPGGGVISVGCCGSGGCLGVQLGRAGATGGGKGAFSCVFRLLAER
jgi:hypothetical protein